MPTQLEKAQAQRLRIVRYYASGWELIVRLLIGVALYIVVRIAFAAVLMKRYDLPYYLTHAPAELFILILTAFLLIILPRKKETRTHFIASLWMPAITIFVLVEWVRFFIAIFGGATMRALAGIVPYALPLSLFVILWLVNVRKKTAGNIRRVLLIILCLLWIADMPFTLRAVRRLDTAITQYGDFFDTLQKEHMVSADLLPSGERSGNVTTILKLNQVNPEDYRLDPDIPALDNLEYVTEIEIVIPGISSDLPPSYQELDLRGFSKIDYHYLYKYSTQRHILLRDLHYRG
ncbi:MAG: hypothetical protein K0B52_05605, partial [FCB group bacterium]|nr:hypothetical protein [FCB group bacterium]